MPSKKDYITQIEGDLKQETEPEDVLRERLARVEAAETDAEAKDAYFTHVKEAGPNAEAETETEVEATPDELE